jgi:hypothetical protein
MEKVKNDSLENKDDNEVALQTIDQTAHLLGNYHKYYTFHSVSSRTRMIESKKIFLSLWKAQSEPEVFTLLDIGCNEGDLSYAILQQAKSELPSNVKCLLYGVDIDGDLIRLAKEKYETKENEGQVQFFNVNMMKEEDLLVFRSNLPEATQFSFISVFSTTMWIHINHGDEGLGTFFKTISGLLADNGALLVEPQPAKCYTNAARRCRKLRIDYPPYLSIVDRTKAKDLLFHIIQNEIHLPNFVYFGTEDWGRSLHLFYNQDQLDLKLPEIC